MNIHKSFTILLLSLCWVTLAAGGLPQTAASQAAATLAVSPATVTVSTCQETEIIVRVENVTDLTGYSLQLSFPTGSLEILAVSNGGFLPEGLFEPTNGFDNATGRIRFGMVQQNSPENPVTPRSGSGELLRIRLRAAQPGQSGQLSLDPDASALVNGQTYLAIPFTASGGAFQTLSCAPTELQLSNSDVAENQAAGTLVGAFTTVDPDNPQDTFTYSLIDPVQYPGNAWFSIEGNQLKTAASLDHETASRVPIQVRSTDQGGNSVEAVFTIFVNDVNDPPALAPIGEKRVAVNSKLSFGAAATDQDEDPADPLTFSLAGAVPEGAQITSEGAFEWTPTAAQGPKTYSLDVCVSDGAASDCETIAVIVTETNVRPTAGDQSLATAEDSPVSFRLTASDYETTGLIYTIVTPPAHGVLSGTAPDLTYRPAANYNGPDTFTFKVNDGTDDSGLGMVSITIHPVPDAPVAQADTYSMLEDTVLTVNAPGVLANDRDADGDQLTAVLETTGRPAHGKLTLNANGSFTYQPEADFFGADHFQYHVSDGVLNSGVVTVTIQVGDVAETTYLYIPIIFH